MNDDSRGGREAGGEVPLGQRLFDRPFLLLGAGLLVMIAVYTLWGLWEVLTLPQATLP